MKLSNANTPKFRIMQEVISLNCLSGLVPLPIGIIEEKYKLNKIADIL